MADYFVAMGVTAGLYALMTLGVNLSWGQAGMINLGLAGFFAIGGYTSALLTKVGMMIPLGILAGIIVATASGAIVALVTARLRSDYLAIVTLGFSESVRICAANEIWLTHGSDGIAGIPGPWRGTLTPAAFNLLFLGIVSIALMVVFVLMQRLTFSPFGRVLRAIRDDEDVTAVAGKHVLSFKVRAFAVSGGALGLAGALYAHFTSYIAPDLFAPLLTLNVVLALVAGGIGNDLGAVLGAVLLITLLEGTRFAAALLPFLAPAQTAALRQMLIAVLLLIVLRALPRGIIPERIGDQTRRP